MDDVNVSIISISSDIGTAAATRWMEQGYNVAGTYRTQSDATALLEQSGAFLTPCDLSDVASIDQASGRMKDHFEAWDVLMTCPATMEPIGDFLECDIDAWCESVALNCTRQMRFLHALLPSRRRDSPQLPLVIMFTGPGTNDARRHLSAEILGKISQLKMCELLSEEIEDARFVIVGPGWVNTKVHGETIKAGSAAGSNYQRTIDILESGKTTPISRVVDFLDWAIEQPRDVISGRNFSIVNDIWGEKRLNDKLSQTPDMFKMRRFLNDWQGDHGDY